MGKSKTVLQNLTAHPGWGGILDVQAESGTKASLSGESATNTLPQPQVHHDHPTACLSYPWADTDFGRLVATYGSNAIIYPQMVGVTSTRVALPLECTESLPIYVNAKQYSAILKRRQVRAKRQAQNKLVKNRKPYLHESRHRHAMKRARGSGGRFFVCMSPSFQRADDISCLVNQHVLTRVVWCEYVFHIRYRPIGAKEGPTTCDMWI